MISRTKKIILWSIGLPVGLGLIIFTIIAGKVEYDYLSWKHKTEAFTASLKKPFQEDNFGGKTPEETWAMFLDALKKNDTDLAVKYFFFFDRDKQRQRFTESIKLGLYESAKEFYKSGHLVKEGDFGDTAYYHIPDPNLKEHIIEAYPINFQLNKYTNVWKITSI